MARKSLNHHFVNSSNNLFRIIRKPVHGSIIIWIILALSIQIFAGEKWVKNELEEKNPTLYIESWSARSSENDQTNTMLFIETSPTDMMFFYNQERYTSRFHITISIFDDQYRRFDHRIVYDSMSVHSYEETKNLEWNRLYRLGFDLPDGEYTAFIQITDDNIQKEARKLITFEVNLASSGEVNVSDILLARRQQVQDPGEGEVYAVLPYPAQVYGQAESTLYCYFEIYRQYGKHSEPVEYTISFIDPDKQQRVLLEKTVTYKSAQIPVFYSFPTDELAPGLYRILVQVSSPGGLYQLEQEHSFMVHQSPVDLRFRAYDKVLQELQLIADENEWRLMQNLPVEERQSALDEFWKRRDPTPATPRNEVMAEFYKRVIFAIEYFKKNAGNENSFCDQAKVYILLGAPATVENHFDRQSQRHTEVWHYQENSLQVVFQDEFGFGGFRLVAPYDLLGQL